MNETIYRVQDKEGRGPFKPGFSHRWMDQEPRVEQRPSIMQDFGVDFMRRILLAEHVGCAFRSVDALLAWFSTGELERLEKLDHYVVELRDCRIVSESKTQLLIARAKPLRVGAVRVKWRDFAAKGKT